MSEQVPEISAEQAHQNAISILRDAMIQAGVSPEDAEIAAPDLVDMAEENS